MVSVRLDSMVSLWTVLGNLRAPKTLCVAGLPVGDEAPAAAAKRGEDFGAPH